MKKITALDLKHRLAFASTGETFKITRLYDDDGDETTVPTDAVSCVIDAGDNWITVNLIGWEKGVTLQ